VELRQLSQYSGGLQAGRPGFGSRRRQDFFLFSTASRPAPKPHPASYPMGTGEARWPGPEADHSPHLVSRSRMVKIDFHSPIRLDDMVLN
jgi:hypothetical protein